MKINNFRDYLKEKEPDVYEGFNMVLHPDFFNMMVLSIEEYREFMDVQKLDETAPKQDNNDYTCNTGGVQ